MELDTIIIGSGAGGLSAAICLAKEGQKVLVLEQHDVPGGWCHSFYLKGHRFTPGVHYIGLLGKGESTSELYEGLGIANDLTFFRMNPKGYDHCWIGDERIDLPADIDELIENLSERFPKEKKNIFKYLTLVRNVSHQIQLIPKMKGFWDAVTIPWRTRHMGKYGMFTLKKVIDWHIKDPLLKTVLNVQCGDHGLPPGLASFPVHCAVMEHYFKGGFYPMGGGGAIVKAMTSKIKELGSEVRTSQNVTRILLEGNKKKRAVGVELEGGEQIFAKRVISNADPDITYLDLVGKEHLSSKLVKRLSETKYSCTSLMLFLVIDMDMRKAGMDSGNIWLMPDKTQNEDELFEEMMKVDIAEGDEFPGFFLSCTTIKDPTSFDGRYHSMEVVTFINHESFAQFKGEDKRKSQGYIDFKEHLIQKIIKTLEKNFPGISEKIVNKELGTPLTNEHYINTTNGCVYGTEKSFKQIGPFSYKAKSEIENLYLCGASVLSHGVAGASYSGVQAAAGILGKTQRDLIQSDDSQSVQIFEAEDAANYPDWIKQKMEQKKSKVEVNTKRFSET
jgi:all-trans-retinol 13,14-reductase